MFHLPVQKPSKNSLAAHGLRRTATDMFLPNVFYPRNLLKCKVAERTGLEPATSAVTGQRSNH